MSSTDTSANVIQKDVDALERSSSIAWDARTAALACLAVYVALTAIVLAVNGHGWLAAIHGCLVAAAVWSASRRNGTAGVVGDFLPLILMPVLYAELPALIAAMGTAPGGRYHDPRVQSWETALFASQLSRTLAERLPFQGLSELLHAGYLAYYVAIFAPPLALFVQRKRRGFAQTVAALTITYAVCWVIFVLVPVEGPRYVWGANPAVPDGPVRRLTLSLLAEGSSRGAAFPSSHMAIMVAQTVMAFRWQRGAAWLLVAVTLLVGVGAVYGGFHYAVDILAGAGLGGAIGAAVLSRWRPLNP